MPPARGSLTGLEVLVELCKATRNLAEQRGFANLAAAYDDALEIAARAPQLDPGDPRRVTVFSRLSALQREALLCFRDNRDTELKEQP